MKWYTAVLNRIFKGVVLFLLPIILLVFILEKAFVIVQKIILPLKEHLPEQRVMGIGLLSLISIILLMLLCYFAGILAEKKKVKKFVSFLENNLLAIIPGYAMIKNRATEAIANSDTDWKVVLVGASDEWKMAIEVGKQPGGYSMVFFPDPPDAKSGEMSLVHESKLKKLDIPVSKLLSIIRTYGHGAGDLIKD